MREIKLTQGKFALVDDEDFDVLSKYKWRAQHNGGDRKHWRAVRYVPKKKFILMHRQVLNFPDSKCIDHADGDSLNNQKQNLRPCTYSQNGYNQGIRKDNTSGYKGVSWNKGNKRWHAVIKNDSKFIFLGGFKDPIEAAKAYDKAARKYHKEFAFQNFPKGGDND